MRKRKLKIFCFALEGKQKKGSRCQSFILKTVKNILKLLKTFKKDLKKMCALVFVHVQKGVIDKEKIKNICKVSENLINGCVVR